jgi:hypothetical protein
MVYCWKFLCQHNMYCLKKDRLAFGLWWWWLFLLLIVCVDEFVWKFIWLEILKFINESMNWRGTARISNCLNKLLHEVLGCAPAIILMIFFCKMKMFPLLEHLPPKKYYIFYNIMKVCKVNLFESVNVIDMDHRPNGVTCST